MKMALILCSVLSLSLSSMAEKVSLAVSDMQATGVDIATATIASEQLRTELLNTGIFRVMERGQMENVLKEQGFQQSGACSDNACIIEMGQLLGVNKIIVGTLGKVGELYTISLRMLDVGTGEILVSESEQCECPFKTVLNESIRKLAVKLAKKASPYSTLNLSTRPQGAAVLLNGKSSDITPFSSDKLAPGEYSITLSLANYSDTMFSTALKPSETVDFSINLRRSDAFLKAQKAKSAKIAWIVRGVSAGVALAALGGGIFFNHRYDKMFDDYLAINTLGDHSADFAAAQAQAKRRNILYGTSGGVAVVGLAVGFAF
jgi:hypothetical protein